MKATKTLISTLLAAGVFLIGAALILAFSVRVDWVPQSSGAPLAAPAIVNYSAPELTLTDLQQETVSLSDYRGRVVLVNNWAIWCPPCKAEMPELLAYYEAHTRDGFVLVAIEAGSARDAVAAFVKAYGLTFPIWLDPHADALDAFQNWTLPSSYLIDQEGIVRYAWSGPLNQQTLENYVTPLLNR